MRAEKNLQDLQAWKEFSNASRVFSLYVRSHYVSTSNGIIEDLNGRERERERERDRERDRQTDRERERGGGGMMTIKDEIMLIKKKGARIL